MTWVRPAILVVAGMLALGAATPPPRPDLAPAVALAHRAEHLKAAFLGQDPAALQAAVQEVDLLRRTYGTLDVQPLVEAMTVWAREQGEQGQPERGLRVLRTLEAWAPGDPALLGTRIGLLRSQGLRGWFASLTDVVELTRQRLEDPVERWMWSFQHLGWLPFLATLLLWGYALALALRYRRVFRYLWEEPLRRRRVGSHLAAALGAVLICLPVLLGLDPGVAAMFWLFLLAPHLMPQELRATVLILLLQLVHPAMALLEPQAAVAPPPSIERLQLQPQASALDARVLAALSAGDQAFLRGWAALQAEDWARAEAIFTELRAGHPDHGVVVNNLGVAKYQRGDMEGARSCFNEAAAQLPPTPEVLLNQSEVAFKAMDSITGALKLEEASRVAPEVYGRLLAANHARKEQRTFALPLPDTPARVQALAAGWGPLENRPWSGAGIPALAYALALPLAALGAVLWRHRKSINEAHPSQCTRCGEPYHTTDSPDTSVCAKCHHLFVVKDGLHGESRKRKVDEAAAYQKAQRLLHRLLVVALPGTDRIFVGDTRGGLTEFGFLAFAMGVVLVSGSPVHYPGEVLADPASIWLPLGLALLVLLYLRSWLKLLPRRA
jgi:tetratricopeptide (TPR) repeat protein